MANTVENQKRYASPSINENFVQLTGTVLHLFKVPGVDTVVLTIATGGGGNKTNYPRVTFYGALANEVENTVSTGERVSVLGMVQTTRHEREVEKPLRRQILVGRGITHAQTKIERAFGIRSERGAYIDDTNEVRLAGSILHMFKVPDQEITIVTIRTFTGHVNSPKIALFGRLSEHIWQEFKENDAVCVIGYISTNRVEKEDGTVAYYEGVTCTSICLAPDQIEQAYGIPR